MALLVNIAQSLVKEATKSGLRFRLNGGRVQVTNNTNDIPNLLQRPREHRDDEECLKFMLLV